MKSARHQAILDLIEKYPIDRQEDLLEHLRCEVFDAQTWEGVVGTLSGDDTFFILMRTEENAAEITRQLQRYTVRHT